MYNLNSEVKFMEPEAEVE